MNVSVYFCVYVYVWMWELSVGLLHDASVCIYVYMSVTMAVGMLYEHVTVYLCVCTYGCETADVL